MTKQRLYLVKYKAKLTSNGYETVSREVIAPLPDDPEEHFDRIAAIFLPDFLATLEGNSEPDDQEEVDSA